MNGMSLKEKAVLASIGMVILYGLASELVLEMQEECCWNIGVRTALVEHLKDALTAVLLRD